MIEPMIGLIWAQTVDGVIGKDNAMPWHVPEDLKHFNQITSGHAVIMGHATWLSLPERFRPLPNRQNIVMSRKQDLALAGAEVAHSVEEVLQLCEPGKQVWFMGGRQIYDLSLPLAQRVEVTKINISVEGDTFAPTIPNYFDVTVNPNFDVWYESTSGTKYRFESYQRQL